jgi:hypothetical protein
MTAAQLLDDEEMGRYSRHPEPPCFAFDFLPEWHHVL